VSECQITHAHFLLLSLCVSGALKAVSTTTRRVFIVLLISILFFFFLSFFRISDRIPSVQRPVKRVLTELKQFAEIYPFAHKTAALYKCRYKLLKVHSAQGDERSGRVVRVVEKVGVLFSSFLNFFIHPISFLKK
jgi:hypothetical protein